MPQMSPRIHTGARILAMPPTTLGQDTDATDLIRIVFFGRKPPITEWLEASAANEREDPHRGSDI